MTSRSSRATMALLAAFAAAILLGRLRLYPAPLHGDICAYAVIGHEMSAGRPLYSDLWERKPPLLYLTFAAAESVAGYGRREILVVGVAAAWATLAAAHVAGRAAGGRAGGLFAAWLWALLSSDLDLAANQPDPEVFINACLTAAVALLLCWPAGRRMAAALVLGGLLAAATFYKHNAALACAALLAGHVVASDRRGRAAVEATGAGLVVVAAWGLFLGHAYAVGRLAATVDVLFSQNVAYSGGSFGGNLFGGLAPARLFPPFLAGVIAPAVLVVAYGWVARRRRRRGGAAGTAGRAWIVWAAWAIGTWATVSLTGLLYPHYYQLWLPVACVGGGWAAAGLWQRAGAGTASRVVVVVAMLAVAARQGAQFLLPPDEWVARQFPYYSVANQNEMARRLDALLRPGETFWVMGSDNAFYFLARRSPPSGLLYFDPLLYGGQTDRYWRRLQSDLDRRPPDVVVFSSDWTSLLFPPRTPIYPWLVQHYRPWQTWAGSSQRPRATTYTLLARRGGRLDGMTVLPATGR